MEIQLLATQELINELSNRFDACIFYGVKYGIDKDKKDTDRFWWHFSGCRATDLGLCDMMKDLLNKDREEKNQDINEMDF